MKYSKIDLMQIERNDVPALKNFINAFRHHLPEHKEVNTELLNERYEALTNDVASYHFSIRGFQEAGYSSSTLGFCGIQNIDWVSRHGELVFLMQDEGSHATIPSTEAGRLAFQKLVRFGFEEANINKLWIQVADGNNIMGVLDDFGFVAEGVRRQAHLKRGEHVDIAICSLLSIEYRERSGS
jgi:RimJ/RimL family protein N-acetyltransferase